MVLKTWAHVQAVWIRQPLIFHQKVLIEITVIKGPQTVQYANTGSAATVLFERKPEQFGEGQNYRGQASVLMGSFGRLDHNIEAAAGDAQKYIRLNANRSVADSYKDGNGTTVPSDWERWNADVL